MKRTLLLALLLLAACGKQGNLTPVPRDGYRIGVTHGGAWRECMNTDSAHYGGTNAGNQGRVEAEPVPMHGQPWSLSLHLPPLAVIWLAPESAA